jgi:hypothetical protein
MNDHDREIYGDPTAPCWDVVMAVDEAANGPLSFRQDRITDRRSGRHRRARRNRILERDRRLQGT